MLRLPAILPRTGRRLRVSDLAKRPVPSDPTTLQHRLLVTGCAPWVWRAPGDPCDIIKPPYYTKASLVLTHEAFDSKKS